MAVHALNIIYQSGGVVDSTQAYWVPLLVVAFFLSGTRIVALVWSALVIGVCLVVMTSACISTDSVFPQYQCLLRTSGGCRNMVWRDYAAGGDLHCTSFYGQAKRRSLSNKQKKRFRRVSRWQPTKRHKVKDACQLC